MKDFLVGFFDKKKPLGTRFLKEQKGVAAIEFAMLLLPFFILIVIIIETSILIYQNSIISYMGFNAASYASSFNYKEGYEEKYKEYLDSRKNQFLAFVKPERLTLKLEYCRNLKELANNSCTGSPQENALVIYNLSYHVNPLFPLAWIDKRARYITSSNIFFSERRDSILDKEEKERLEKLKALTTQST
ncbi:TadE/TadG family type IV pilus assembly protein [Helicobacter sp. 11S02629-2]|uniref:TadE/TadG family type IV pilus assembly protein n=1 Tax=Helicobacter sp. 11S02629-2 TaxID=1476195 RepID=UPI000BA59B3B|nr:TadE/TadG family type IV pilus assembly protein [Helicobacter sp. 11S02629-2]PAF45748.1 hypothetical protein BKH40_02410 [Helicobacter sp. 11S02629-2]